MRLLRAEGADAGQGQREGRPVNTVERVSDLVGDVAFDIADKAQGQMIVFDVDPAGPGQSAAQQRQRKSGITRYFEGGEKSRHGQAPFLESYSTASANHRFCGRASSFFALHALARISRGLW